MSNTSEDKFKIISDVINDFNFRPEEVGKMLARDHRHLQGSTMQMVLAFLKEMQKNFKNKYYDARNETACKMAANLLDEDFSKTF